MENYRFIEQRRTDTEPNKYPYFLIKLVKKILVSVENIRFFLVSLTLGLALTLVFKFSFEIVSRRPGTQRGLSSRLAFGSLS